MNYLFTTNKGAHTLRRYGKSVKLTVALRNFHPIVNLETKGSKS